MQWRMRQREQDRQTEKCAVYRTLSDFVCHMFGTDILIMQNGPNYSVVLSYFYCWIVITEK